MLWKPLLLFIKKILIFDLDIDRFAVDKIDNLKKQIIDLFILDYSESSWKNCDQIIFPKDSNTPGLWSIDLSSFNLSRLDYIQK